MFHFFKALGFIFPTVNMRYGLLLGATAAARAQAASLGGFCKAAYVQAALPADGTIAGITLDPTSATANAVYNASISGEGFFPDATFNYCNVTVACSHNGRDDQVLLQWWLPTPADFQNRYLTTGGFAYSINTGKGNPKLGDGVQYGAVAGITDGGFGGFSTTFDEVFLLAHNS